MHDSEVQDVEEEPMDKVVYRMQSAAAGTLWPDRWGQIAFDERPDRILIRLSHPNPLVSSWDHNNFIAWLIQSFLHSSLFTWYYVAKGIEVAVPKTVWERRHED